MIKADLKCLVLDYFVEEDLISDDKLNSVDNKIEIKGLELEHQVTQQEKDDVN